MLALHGLHISLPAVNVRKMHRSRNDILLFFFYQKLWLILSLAIFFPPFDKYTLSSWATANDCDFRLTQLPIKSELLQLQVNAWVGLFTFYWVCGSKLMFIRE